MSKMSEIDIMIHNQEDRQKDKENLSAMYDTITNLQQIINDRDTEIDELMHIIHCLKDDNEKLKARIEKHQCLYSDTII